MFFEKNRYCFQNTHVFPDNNVERIRTNVTQRNSMSIPFFSFSISKHKNTMKLPFVPEQISPRDYIAGIVEKKMVYVTVSRQTR